MNSKVSICNSCGGQGQYLVTGQIGCPSCAGTGRDFNHATGPGVCGRCRGSGKVVYTKYERCNRCGGSGRQ